jgi:hypothetical protein
VVRRLVARVADHSAAVTDELLHPDEVLVFGADSPWSRAMATGSPVLFGRLDGETAERISRRPGGEDFVSDFTSFLAVPLEARGSMVGCAMFGRAARSPAFGRTDMTLASELADRTAVCIDNALLYRRERRTAVALQRGLLPGQPDIPAEMEVAHRYLPVGARLDRMAARMASAPFATCICAVLDPSDCSCVIAQAGHLPPVLALAAGGTQVFDLPPGSRSAAPARQSPSRCAITVRTTSPWCWRASASADHSAASLMSSSFHSRGLPVIWRPWAIAESATSHFL